jgi:hypothetical protein
VVATATRLGDVDVTVLRDGDVARVVEPGRDHVHVDPVVMAVRARGRGRDECQSGGKRDQPWRFPHCPSSSRMDSASRL